MLPIQEHSWRFLNEDTAVNWPQFRIYQEVNGLPNNAYFPWYKPRKEPILSYSAHHMSRVPLNGKQQYHPTFSLTKSSNDAI